MRSFWTIAAPYVGTPVAEAFSSLAATFAATGHDVAASPISRVIRKEIGAEVFFVKTYTAGGKSLRRWIGRSRAQAEWENLIFFQKLGIATAPLVAYGQERRYGLFRQAALVTAALKDTRDLQSLYRESHPILQDRAWMRDVARQVADYTRRLHQNRFGHLDLKWRNILVTVKGAPEVFFIDCPAGRLRRGPGSGRWFIKDLACLDKVARKCLTRTQRLAFFLTYRELRQLTPADKQKIHAILRFFQGRE